jgi:hypothetical protein
MSEVPFASWAGPARWYSTGRDGKAPRFIVIHYTAGAEGRDAAENGAAYDRRRSEQVSTHFFVDSNSIVQEVLIKDRAYAAYSKGNRLGIQIEICGTVQTRAQWLDSVSDATLTNTARLCAELCKRYGFEPRRLSHAEMRDTWNRFPNGPRGIVGHVDCTVAYGEGDHTDPGPQFPWDVLLTRTREFLGGSPVPLTEGDPEMIKVLAVPRPDQVHYLGLIAGGKPVPIGNNTDLERWRALARAALQPTDLSIPSDLYDAAFGGSVEVPDFPGGEMLAAVVAAAVDSRIAALARATVDEAVARVAAAGNG